MTKLLTKEKRRHLRQLVTECVLFGFSTRQAQRYITDKLGQPISDSYYYETRSDLLEQSQTKVQYYIDKSNSIYYEKFIDRIEELEFARTKIFELLTNNDKDPKLQLEVIESLRGLNKSLLELYAALPGYTDDYNDDNNMNTKTNKLESEAERIERERRQAAQYSEEAKF